MKPVEFGVDITLNGGASVENLKPKTLNCSAYDFGVANHRDDLPANPVAGQMFHSSIDDRIYRWGIERNNDISSAIGYSWFPIADQVSEFGFDELSSPQVGAGYYRYNVAANEASVRQAFEDVSAIGAAFFDMSSLRTLNLDNATTPYEIQVIVQQGYMVTQPQIQPYVVNNPYAPRVIRVKNPENQNPTLFNDTIAVVTGDILLPKYRTDNGSWTYEVVRTNKNAERAAPFFDYVFSLRTKLQSDAEFTSTTNNIVIYNNSGNGVVTMQRQSVLGIANSSGYGLVFQTSAGTSAPYWGGMAIQNQTYAKARFLLVFRAKIPVGRQVTWHSNSVGSGGSMQWISSQEGTGNYTDYIVLLNCGTTGLFQHTNYIAIAGGDTPTAQNPLIWTLAFCQVYDITDNYGGKLTTAQINAISNPTTGVEVYNTTLNTMCFHNGSSWQKVTSSAM